MGNRLEQDLYAHRRRRQHRPGRRRARAKESLRVEAYGTVDEANSAVGVVLAVAGAAARGRALPHRGAARSVRSRRRTVHSRASHDRRRPTWSGSRPSSTASTKPCRRSRSSFCRAAVPAAAACHVARTVCRRAERRCWSLARVEEVAPDALKYLNRLSDLLVRAGAGAGAPRNRQRGALAPPALTTPSTPRPSLRRVRGPGSRAASLCASAPDR